ncbi:hypothetical protein UlMin_040559 [Ulmus minor]
MSPSKFSDDDHARKLQINGTRPSPLKINKDSHSIHKPSSGAGAGNKQQTRQPVIIYTYSPKIIYAQPREFMALVQKLTGRLSDEDGTKTKPQNDENDESFSSAVTDENCANNGEIDVKTSFTSSIRSPATANLPNPYFAEIPLFTPSSADLFCSPRPVHRFPEPACGSPNMGGLFSPSFMEFMKGLPEY